MPGDPALHVSGPSFGVMVRRRAAYESGSPRSGHRVGSLDGRRLLAHNAFVFARWNHRASNGWRESERCASTVGIIDLTGPACAIIGAPDPNELRVGDCFIVSNIVGARSVSGTPSLRPFATLGVDDECDTTPCKHAYFNLQGVIMEDPSWPTATIEVLRGNMQAEYR